MNDQKEAPKQIPLAELPFKDLAVCLQQAESALAKIKPGESGYDDARQEFSQVIAVMDEQTDGMYSYLGGLEEDLKEGLPINKELELAGQRAAELENSEARRFVKKRIGGLEKKGLKKKKERPVKDKEKKKRTEGPFAKLDDADLINRLEKAEAGLAGGKPGEPEYEEGKKELPGLTEEMNKRTRGLYGLIGGLEQDFSEGRNIIDDLIGAKREALRLRARNQELGKLLRDKVEALEDKVKEREKQALRPKADGLALPEPKETRGCQMRNAKPAEDLPAVYLSQLFTTSLKGLDLPLRERRPFKMEEEGTVMARVYPVETVPQAVKAGLSELSAYIVESESPLNNLQKSMVRYYIGLVRDWAGKDSPIYHDMNTLAEGVFNLFEVMYGNGGWLGVKGKKHPGIKDNLTKITGKLPTSVIHFLRQDPEIESATHRIRGEVVHESFLKGQSGRDELGDILGGDYGAAEKVGYFIGLLEYQGVFAGYGPVRKACYNALYLRNTLRVLGTKGTYENVMRLFQPVYVYDDEHGERKWGSGISPEKEEVAEIPVGGIVYRKQKCGIVPYPSAHHMPTINTEWILDNFEEDTLGWENLGRMLVIYGDYDARYSQWQAGEKGCYTIEQWLFASPDEKKEMYQLALASFRDLEENDRSKALTIIRNNLLGIYDYARKKEGGKLKWFTKPLLDFDERDEKDRYIIDIGSLDETNWCGGREGDYLNEFYTAEEYAWREYNIFDELSQIDPEHQMDRFKTLMRQLTANEGYRHLTEDAKGRPVALLALRRKQTEHIFSVFSANWMAWIWADRREGRRNPEGKPLAWELDINQKLRLGLELEVYRKEFETAGIYGVDLTNAYGKQDRYDYQEKVAKILSRFESKDAWIAYLEGVVGLDKKIVRVLDIPHQELAETNEIRLTSAGHKRLIEIAQGNGLYADLEKQEENGRVWKFYPSKIGKVREVGFRQASEEEKAEIILKELTYRAITCFAGYKIDREFLEYDQYGLPVWRTWFDFDFDLETGRGRGDGETRKAIFEDNQWAGIKDFLMYSGSLAEGKPKGALDNDEYSPFKYMSEKLEEDIVAGGIGEAFFRQSFDRDERHYTPQRWRGMARMDKKRWDEYAHMYRNRRYTAGNLKGKYVISQLQIEINPMTSLPRFENSRTGKIIEAKLGPSGELVIIHPETGQPVVVEIDEITKLPKNTDPEHWRARLLHIALNEGELPTPEIAWFGDPGLSGHDKIGTLTWGTEGVRSTRKENEGMGVAGLEKQLTWEPLFYNKNIRLAFFLARYGDPRYIYEVARNSGIEWKIGNLHQLVMDEEQRTEFYDGLLTIVGEDAGWKLAEKMRAGIDPGRVLEYADLKKKKRIPNVKGEVRTGASEEQLMSLLDLVKRAVPLKSLTGAIPVLRSAEERFCFFRGVFLGEIATVAAVGLSLASPGTALLTPALVFVAGQIPSILLGMQFTDKGVDEQGKEKARGLARVLGTFLKTGELSGLTLGMIGYRQRGSDPYNLAVGWDPYHDSALPMKDLLEYWFLYPKEKLLRMRTGA